MPQGGVVGRLPFAVYQVLSAVCWAVTHECKCCSVPRDVVRYNWMPTGPECRNNMHVTAETCVHCHSSSLAPRLRSGMMRFPGSKGEDEGGLIRPDTDSCEKGEVVSLGESELAWWCDL